MIDARYDPGPRMPPSDSYILAFRGLAGGARDCNGSPRVDDRGEELQESLRGMGIEEKGHILTENILARYGKGGWMDQHTQPGTV